MIDKEKNFLEKYQRIKKKGFYYYMITRIIIAVSALMLVFSILSKYNYGNFFNNNLFQFIWFLVFSFVLGFFISKDSCKNYKDKYDKLNLVISTVIGKSQK